jgi:hypothetical protein
VTVSASSVLHRRVVSLAALLGYGLASALFLGLPLLVESGQRYVGNGRDATLVIWAFGWWPHAILHGLNPIFTHVVWSPDGVNLTWITSVPGLALLFAPLTLLAGPFAAYDVAAVLAPAAAAWTAFLLCRRLTSSLWPSLAGGFLFGCSSFELAHAEAGHLNLTAAAAVVPLVALVILRFLDGELSGRGLVLQLAPLLAFELLLATELAFSTALAIVVALATAFVLVPARRASLRRFVPALLGAYLLAGLLTAPFVYYLLSGFHQGSFSPPGGYVADLLTFVAPAGILAAGAGGVGAAIARTFPDLVAQPEAYVGLPVLVVAVLYARKQIRTPGGRFLLAVFGLAAIATLGPSLTVAGHRLVSLPWRLLVNLPGFDNVLPVRLSVYLELAAAVLVALWAAGSGSRALRLGLTLLAIAAILPDPLNVVRSTPYSLEPFFTAGRYQSCLDPGETVLPLPIGQGDAMLWQVASGFRFRLAGGFTGLSIPAGFTTPGPLQYVTVGNHLGPGQAAAVRTFVAAEHVTSVVVAGDEAPFFSGALDRLATPQTVGGVVVYRFSSTPASCLGP